MTTSLIGKRVLILSDNIALSKAIETSLGRLEAEVIQLAPSSVEQSMGRTSVGSCDLIVATATQPANGPRSTLYVTLRDGQVPLLVVSDTPICAKPRDQAVVADTAIRIDELCHVVREILQRSWGTENSKNEYEGDNGRPC